MLKTSNFSFCHNVSTLYRCFIVMHRCFQSRLLQICCMWERVKLKNDFSEKLFILLTDMPITTIKKWWSQGVNLTITHKWWSPDMIIRHAHNNYHKVMITRHAHNGYSKVLISWRGYNNFWIMLTQGMHITITHKCWSLNMTITTT